MVNWRQVIQDENQPPAVVDSRKRLQILLAVFALAMLAVFCRAAHIQLAQGEAFRGDATRPLRRETTQPGIRGRIVSADGVLLACDREEPALAVPYRRLEEPANKSWLRRTARARLSKTDRKNREKLAAAEALVLADRAAMYARLAQLCGLTPQEWQRRTAVIQRRVERIAETVNRRAEAAHRAVAAEPETLSGKAMQAVRDALSAARDEPPPRIVVTEELDDHVVAEHLPPAAVAEIEQHPDRYPGVKIRLQPHRAYPEGRLAAHVLGHLGPVDQAEIDGSRDRQPSYEASDMVGRMGLERQYEAALCGLRGVLVEMTDRSGRVLSSLHERSSQEGCTLRLTLDTRLQRTAEELLAGALERHTALGDKAGAADGGAIVVLDVGSGAVRAAASSPRFDPNWFGAHDSPELAAALRDAGRPMFDRAARMAIPPGSVFKTLTAAALLESNTVRPEDRFACQGYLRDPGHQRCELFVRRGKGHGEVTLYDALAQSCNVYFFDRAAKMGPKPLLTWAGRFGFGRATGIDLPGEAAGLVPTPDTIGALENHPWTTADTQAMAIGQGSLTATPMQIARLMAAVANGGQLVTPHLASRLEPAPGGVAQGGSAPESFPRRTAALATVPPRPVEGLHRSTLSALGIGLERVVAAAEGSAHGTLFMESIPVAGKTGTAETGPDRASHAWFAGYVPADRPKLAFVVVLEHAGSGATAAGPVAKRLVLKMQELGMW